MFWQAIFRKTTAKSWRSLFSVTFTVLLTACAGSPSNQSSSEGSTSTAKESGTLTWARYGDADSLDPQRTTTTLSWQIFDQIYDTLLAFNDQGEVVPNLAKEWKISPDGKEITFVLNQGVSCHDGTPFDAKDVKFTAERALNTKNPSVTKGAWGPSATLKWLIHKRSSLSSKPPLEPSFPSWQIHLPA